jgi:hypothetical protein
VLPKRVPVFFSPPAGFPKLKDMVYEIEDMRVCFYADLKVMQTSDGFPGRGWRSFNVCFRSRVGTRRRRWLRSRRGNYLKDTQSARISIDGESGRCAKAQSRCRWSSERLLSVAHKGQAQVAADGIPASFSEAPRPTSATTSRASSPIHEPIARHWHLTLKMSSRQPR